MCDLLETILSPSEFGTKSKSLCVEDTLHEDVAREVRSLENRSDFQMTALSDLVVTPPTQHLTSTDVRTALYTERLVRDLFEAQEKARTLSEDMIRSKGEAHDHAESLEKQLQVCRSELQSWKDDLREAHRARSVAEQKADQASTEAGAAIRQTQLVHEQMRRSKVANAAAALELDVLAEKMRLADDEVASTHRQLEDVDRNCRKQMINKEHQVEELRARCVEMQTRLEHCEAALHGHEACARGASLLSRLGTSKEELEQTGCRALSEQAQLEATVQDLRSKSQRHVARLDSLEAENSSLRERCRILQEASDRDASKIRDYEDACMERNQLREQVVNLREQLVETKQQLQEVRAEREMLLVHLSAKLEREVLHALPENEQLVWLDPIQRRVAELEDLLKQALENEKAALAAANQAREEVAEHAASIAAEQEENGRLQRRLVEANMRLDQSFQRSAALTETLEEEAEKRMTLRLDDMKKQLLAEQQQATCYEQQELQAKVARLEMAKAQHDGEMSSFIRLRAVVEDLEATGGLTSLGQTLAALKVAAETEQPNNRSACESQGQQLQTAPAA